MSSAATARSQVSFSGDETAEIASYRSVSLAAILAAVFAVVGLLSLEWPALIVVPVAGLVAAISALISLRKHPIELTGKPIAYAALAANALLFVGAPIYHTYVYMTELPPGYERVAFIDLNSPLGAPDVPPPFALNLDGKQVFLKGYIHPSSISSANGKNFILVPDFATCCFGGQPPLTHMIEVNLTGDLYATATKRKISLAGTLTVDPVLKPINGMGGVYYQLRADYIK